MRTFALAILSLGASAWKLHDYAKHAGYENPYAASTDDYEDVQQIELGDIPDRIAYAPALTESTDVETITDRVLWNKLTNKWGLERYTHAHHGTDPDDTQPTKDHIYPQEHAHYREINYLEREPVIVNQERKVYHVTPQRYTRAGYDEEEEELGYVEDYYFPTTKPDQLWTDNLKRAHGKGKGAGFGIDKGFHGLVPQLNPLPGGGP